MIDQSFVLQGKQKDGSPFGEYGGWYKACKVDRSVRLGVQAANIKKHNDRVLIQSNISLQE